MGREAGREARRKEIRGGDKWGKIGEMKAVKGIEVMIGET